MTKHFALSLLLIVGLAACKADAPETAAAGAGTEAAAASAGPIQASAVDANVEREAAEAAARMQAEAASAPPLVAGTDYEVIRNGQPFEPVAGKIEVAEVFNHVCPACASFQPLIGAWKATLPADVNFVYVPAPFGRAFDTYVRAFYAADALGAEAKAHDALYRAIHIDNTLKGERGQDTPQDIARFYQGYGVDPAQFAEAMGSFAVEGRLNKAKKFIQDSGVTGTPTLIVAGKYRVSGGETRQDQIRIANQLIAMERAATGGDGAAAPAAEPEAAN